LHRVVCLKSEGDGDGGLFKGILVRYLTLLTLKEDVAAADRDAYTKFLKYNAETLFTKGINRPELMVSPDWKTNHQVQRTLPHKLVVLP
jgi:predicted alpha-1,6-mannanase (GH76 family)